MQGKDEYLRLLRTHRALFANPADAPIRIVCDEPDIHEVEQACGRECGVCYEDSYIMLLRDAVIMPGGQPNTYIRILPKMLLPGVVVMPVLADDSVLVLRHFRHAMRRWLLELPRGFADEGETPIDTARRELAEETGLDLDESCFVEIGRSHPDSGLQAGFVTYFLAQVPAESSRGIDTPKPIDEEEGIGRLMTFTRDELWGRVAAGEIVDGFTLTALAFDRAHTSKEVAGA